MRFPLTDGAKQVLELAADAAGRDDVHEFGADFVLQAMAHYSRAYPNVNRVATVVLRNLHVPVDRFSLPLIVRQPLVHRPLARPSPALIEAAAMEARGLGQPYVGSEHLLLAVGRTDSSAARFLMEIGATYDVIRREIRRLTGV